MNFTRSVGSKRYPVCCTKKIVSTGLRTPSNVDNIFESIGSLRPQVERARYESSYTVSGQPLTAVTKWEKLHLQAFFSCMVRSCQSIFIRSLRAIHNSACSWGDMTSHRFSIPASVGLDIACPVLAGRVRCCCMTTAQAGLVDLEGEVAVRRHGRRYKELLAARGSERSIVMSGGGGGWILLSRNAHTRAFAAPGSRNVSNVSSQWIECIVAVLTFFAGKSKITIEVDWN